MSLIRVDLSPWRSKHHRDLRFFTVIHPQIYCDSRCVTADGINTVDYGAESHLLIVCQKRPALIRMASGLYAPRSSAESSQTPCFIPHRLAIQAIHLKIRKLRRKQALADEIEEQVTCPKKSFDQPLRCCFRSGFLMSSSAVLTELLLLLPSSALIANALEGASISLANCPSKYAASSYIPARPAAFLYALQFSKCTRADHESSMRGEVYLLKRQACNLWRSITRSVLHGISKSSA